MAKRTIILGASNGGAWLATRLRRLDEFHEIILVELTDQYLSMNTSLQGLLREEKWMSLWQPFEAKYHVKVLFSHRIHQLDPHAKRIRIQLVDEEDIKDYPYDFLVVFLDQVAPAMLNHDQFSYHLIEQNDDILALHQRFQQQGIHQITIPLKDLYAPMFYRIWKQLGYLVKILYCNPETMPFDPEMLYLFEQTCIQEGIEFEQGSTKHPTPCLVDYTQDSSVLKVIKNVLFHREESDCFFIDEKEWNQYEDLYFAGDVQRKSQTTAFPRFASASQRQIQTRAIASQIIRKAQITDSILVSAVIAFDHLSLGMIGSSERELQVQNIPYTTTYLQPGSVLFAQDKAIHRHVKILHHPQTCALLGAQVITNEPNDFLLDGLAMALQSHIPITEFEKILFPRTLFQIEEKNPFTVIAKTIQNQNELVVNFYPNEVDVLLRQKAFFLDVREFAEISVSRLDESIWIPLGSLRERMNELPKNKTIYVYCRSGVRSYLACRMLEQHQFTCKNLTGGFTAYQANKSVFRKTMN